jgi:phosphoadenosine phosphosulfate reductase
MFEESAGSTDSARVESALEGEDFLARENARLEKSSAEERVQWALDRFKPNLILSSSFGAQSAVSLHLATQLWPEIPIVLLDTGYLFPETYRFIDQLVEQLHLNLKVYRAEMSSAWQEARWGKKWEHGLEGIEAYNRLNKVEPMQRALRELQVRGWISGLRRQQTKSRQDLGVLKLQNGIVKIHPIIDWTDRQVFQYLTRHGLPYHPLWEKGYVSIGDVHTTRPLTAEMTEEETRFFGLKRECGIHEAYPDVGL